LARATLASRAIANGLAGIVLLYEMYLAAGGDITPVLLFVVAFGLAILFLVCIASLYNSALNEHLKKSRKSSPAARERLTSVAGNVSTSWQPITEFTEAGSISYTTGYFTCEYAGWRINWDYTPSSNNPEEASR
jgi:preprotein translocase subunit Sec61beta